MKYAQLKKKLVLEGIVVFMILAVLGGASYYIMTMQEESSSKRNALEGAVRQVSNETNALREKFIRIQKDKDLYQLVMSLNDADMLSHTDSIVDKLFRGYGEMYSVQLKLDRTASNATLDENTYKRKTSVINQKDAVISDIQAANDEDIFEIMQAIQKEFPGAVSYTGLKLTRESRLTDEALRSITQKGTFPLVKGEVKFSWYGIDPVDPEEQKKVETSRRKRRR